MESQSSISHHRHHRHRHFHQSIINHQSSIINHHGVLSLGHKTHEQIIKTHRSPETLARKPMSLGNICIKQQVFTIVFTRSSFVPTLKCFCISTRAASRFSGLGRLNEGDWTKEIIRRKPCLLGLSNTGWWCNNHLEKY